MNTPLAGDDLAAKYEAIAYAARPHAASHPQQMATVATLFGLTPPPVATASVLEVGCSNGANLLPMAVTLPGAKLVGCDLAPGAIAAARAIAAGAGLANVRFEACDLRELPAALGPFDYIVAHGVYSWVPAPVRDALFELAATRLSDNGLLYVSYNTLPGCHVRRVAWDIMHYHTDRIADPRARLDAARALCAMLADSGDTNETTSTVLRAEFRRLAQETDSALFHDDLAVPNDPVYFHEFVAHAARHDLRFVAEAEAWSMSGAGLAMPMRQLLAGMDPIGREQYVDFARLRRFRRSLLCRAGGERLQGWSPQRVAAMHLGASSALIRATAEDRVPLGAATGDPHVETMRALLRWLAEIAPRAVPAGGVKAWLQERSARATPGASVRPAEELMLEAFFSGMADLSLTPPSLTMTITERPRASALARWQARTQEELTSLRHEQVRIPDPLAREVLGQLDGTRDRTRLQDSLTVALPAEERATAASRLDYYLRNFAQLALLQEP